MLYLGELSYEHLFSIWERYFQLVALWRKEQRHLLVQVKQLFCLNVKSLHILAVHVMYRLSRVFLFCLLEEPARPVLARLLRVVWLVIKPGASRIWTERAACRNARMEPTRTAQFRHNWDVFLASNFFNIYFKPNLRDLHKSRFMMLFLLIGISNCVTCLIGVSYIY